MAPLSYVVAQETAKLFNTERDMRVLDVAASHGLFGIAIAQRNPKASIVSTDWPTVLAIGRTPAAIEKLSPEAAVAWMAASANKSGHNTHFSIVDVAGNAVANTYTMDIPFGSAVTTSDGFLLNSEMDDFTGQPSTPNAMELIQAEANAIAPGHRPLSSMTPTILLRDGKLSFVTGSPGGPQIISATLLGAA